MCTFVMADQQIWSHFSLCQFCERLLWAERGSAALGWLGWLLRWADISEPSASALHCGQLQPLATARQVVHRVRPGLVHIRNITMLCLAPNSLYLTAALRSKQCFNENLIIIPQEQRVLNIYNNHTASRELNQPTHSVLVEQGPTQVCHENAMWRWCSDVTITSWCGADIPLGSVTQPVIIVIPESSWRVTTLTWHMTHAPLTNLNTARNSHQDQAGVSMLKWLPSFLSPGSIDGMNVRRLHAPAAIRHCDMLLGYHFPDKMYCSGPRLRRPFGIIITADLARAHNYTSHPGPGQDVSAINRSSGRQNVGILRTSHIIQQQFGCHQQQHQHAAGSAS